MQSGENVGADIELNLFSHGTLFHGCYEVVRCLGTGGMGAVYEVLHHATKRRRVLKTMLPTLLADPDMRGRFKQEATITAGIESDHIVEVFDAGIDEASGLPFLIMEYLRGENLAEVLRRRGRLDASMVVALLHQASLALERTHAAGIVHRDLKPENLFLTQRDDGSPRLKLLDFGIAKVVAQSANLNTTRAFGTPLYMSPEQIRGDGTIDGRADLYALGQIAFTLLVGYAYWSPETETSAGVYSLLLKVVDGASEPALVRADQRGVRLPAAFDEWYSRATHRLVSERFDSASELVEQLADALSVERPRVVAAAAPLLGPPRSEQAAEPVSAKGVEAPQVPTLEAVTETSDRGGAPPSGRADSAKSRWRWAVLSVVGLAGVVMLGVSVNGASSSVSTNAPGAQTMANQSPILAIQPTSMPGDAPSVRDAGAIDALAVGGSVSTREPSGPSRNKKPSRSGAKASRTRGASSAAIGGEDPSDLR